MPGLGSMIQGQQPSAQLYTWQRSAVSQLTNSACEISSCFSRICDQPPCWIRACVPWASWFHYGGVCGSGYDWCDSWTWPWLWLWNFCAVGTVHFRTWRKSTATAMAKSKNHTNHNQNRKHHRNGIKKPMAHRHESNKGVSNIMWWIDKIELFWCLSRALFSQSDVRLTTNF